LIFWQFGRESLAGGMVSSNMRHTVKNIYEIPGFVLTKPSWDWDWVNCPGQGEFDK